MDNAPEVTLLRVFTDAEGKTHFGETRVKTSLTSFAPPAPPMYVSEPVEAKRTVFMVLPVGWYGEPHPAPRRQLMSGTVEVTVSDGEKQVSKSGDISLFEDTSGEGHATKNVGKEPAVVIVTQFEIFAETPECHVTLTPSLVPTKYPKM